MTTPIKDLLEPEADSVASFESQAFLSIAISLKRIADLIEFGDNQYDSLLRSVESIARFGR